MPHAQKRIVAHLDGLFGFAFTLTRNVEEAEDLVQDTALRALKARNVPPNDTAYRVWLYRILRNKFIDQTRKSIPEPYDPQVLSEMQAVDAHAEERQITTLTVHQAFEILSDEHRQILSLIDIAGMSYGEAAQVLGIPDGTVMSRVSRARAKMIEAIEGGNVVAFPVKQKRYDRNRGDN